jgi:ATP-binding cassette subfamily B protein
MTQQTRSTSAEQTTGAGLGGFVRFSARLVRPHWRQVLLVLLAMAPAVAYTAVYPLILQALIDHAILPGRGEVAVTLIGGLVALLALTWIGDVVHQYLVARLVADAGNALRLRVFQHLQDLQVRAYARFEGGDILARCMTGAEAIEQALTLVFSSLLAQLATILVGGAVLFWIEWRLALLCFALMPIVYLGPRIFGHRVEQASAVRQADAARLVGTLQENLATQPVVKAFGLRDVARQRFQAGLQQYWHSSVRFGFLSSLLVSTLWRSGAVLLIVCLSVGSLMALRGELSVGSLVAFFELLWWMVAAFQSLADAVPALQMAATAQHRLDDLLGQPTETAAPGADDRLPLMETQVRVDNVSYAYDDGSLALDQVSLSLPAFRSVAIVGPSGSGKSTLLSMLLGFYQPAGGRIALDGRELTPDTVHAFRRQTGVVFQESLLFDTTVRENIRLGRLDASDEDVEQAARAAELHDAILALPQGYETRIGERGGRLSGGQRQRLALARALIRAPRLLLLDEATSALDPLTEASITDTLRHLDGSCTIVAATHRLATVKHFERIFVMERGRLVEQGGHDELLRAGGLYARLWARQDGFVPASEDGRHARVEADRLRQVPLFGELEGPDLDVLADRFITQWFEAGDVICSEGEVGERFYLLARGTVEVLKRVESGEPRVLTVLDAGDYFGEIALLEQVPRTATVRARSRCQVLTLDSQQFRNLLRVAPRLRSTFEQTARKRRDELERFVEDARQEAPDSEPELVTG